MDDSKKTERESIVPGGTSLVRIDKYLAKRFTYYSRSEWQKKIAGGLISCNGDKVRSPGTKVRPGDTICYENPDAKEPDVDTGYNIIYQDSWLVGINKTGNLPVHPAGTYMRNTLLTLLEEELNKKLYPIHRLDRETSGVILMAKDRDTASAVQKNFDSVKKEYIALVHGNTEWKRKEVHVPIGDDAASAVRKKRAAFTEAPEKALTRFRVLRSYKSYTLLKAMPETGRLHQIRVHCSYLGMPIVGDKLYGRDEYAYLEFIEGGMSEEMQRKMEMGRSALHSRSVRFFHPGLKKEIRIKAGLPEDMKKFIERIK